MSILILILLLVLRLGIARERSIKLTVEVTWHFYIGMLAFLNGEDKKVSFLPPYGRSEGVDGNRQMRNYLGLWSTVQQAPSGIKSTSSSYFFSLPKSSHHFSPTPLSVPQSHP
jgi:hypothetical protein